MAIQSALDVLPLPVADGGTGAATLTGVLIGNGTSAVSAQAPLGVANGGIGAATLTSNGMLYGNGTGAVQAVAAGSTGQVMVATSASAPSWANDPTFNIVDATGTTQAMAVSTTYVADHASATVVFTLPASATLGQMIMVVGNGPGGWKIAQNANQAIKVGSLTSTTGTGGSVSSSSRYQAITLQCVVAGASTIWNAVNYSGSFTIV